MPKRNQQQEGEPLPHKNKRKGIPYVPQIWPSYEIFKEVFDAAAARVRKEKDLGIDEDGPITMRPYSDTDLKYPRFTPIRRPGMDDED